VRTLCVDIGGTGVKVMVVGPGGEALTERLRVPTPRPAVPDAVLDAVVELARGAGDHDRVSVGFPGVVQEGVTKSAPNLSPDWRGFPLAADLERRLGKPVRAANDAGVQGLGVIEGRGVEMVLTLGTGLGCGLYVDGRYVPNLELAHHPYRKRETYEQRVSDTARKAIGNDRWNNRVRKIVAQLGPIFNYRRLYLGGGNAKHLELDRLPAEVTVVENVAGLLGGVRLWDGEPPAPPPRKKRAPRKASVEVP
jgi:polyphosphate glucokinase